MATHVQHTDHEHLSLRVATIVRRYLKYMNVYFQHFGVYVRTQCTHLHGSVPHLLRVALRVGVGEALKHAQVTIMALPIDAATAAAADDTASKATVATASPIIAAAASHSSSGCIAVCLCAHCNQHGEALGYLAGGDFWQVCSDIGELGVAIIICCSACRVSTCGVQTSILSMTDDCSYACRVSSSAERECHIAQALEPIRYEEVAKCHVENHVCSRVTHYSWHDWMRFKQVS